MRVTRARWIALSFVMRQRCFPHIGMFSFLHRQCIKLLESCLRNKMYLHSTLKGCFLVLKYFDQSQELKTIAKKSLQFFAFQHVRCRCCYRSYLDGFLMSTWTRRTEKELERGMKRPISLEDKRENFIAAVRKWEMPAATKVKMSGSENKKVSRNTYVIGPS